MGGYASLLSIADTSVKCRIRNSERVPYGHEMVQKKKQEKVRRLRD